MKKRNVRMRCGLLACAGLAVLLSPGCETESSTQADIQVTPGFSEVSRGESVALSASGWSRYRWSLAHPDWGRLSAGTGDHVVYTATRAPARGSAFTQVVHVRADTPQSTTNTVGVTIAGTAHVRHRTAHDGSTPPTGSATPPATTPETP